MDGGVPESSGSHPISARPDPYLSGRRVEGPGLVMRGDGPADVLRDLLGLLFVPIGSMAVKP
jgi:hypothetical protein